MKHLTILATVALLILAAGLNAAERPPSPTPTVPRQEPLPQNLSSSVFMKVDPLLVELAGVLKTMHAREDELLAELANATDEKQTAIIIRRIEKLDTDRELALLKVQARFARLDGRFDLEKKIKEKMRKVLNVELVDLN